MRVLWPHNFDPAKPNSQVFMNIAADGLRARGIDLQCEYLGNLRSVRNMMTVRKRIRRLAPNFDVVHAQYGSACAFATAAAEGVPKVLSIRGNDWNVHSATIGFHYVHSRFARWFTRCSLPAFDMILTVSRRVAEDVRRFVPETTIVPMPSPVDLRTFVPRDRKEARTLLGFPDSVHERWVLFNAINLDDPIKRFALAKRAFDLARESCANLRLCIASGLPHSELPLLTAACDVILCTSETEGWPNCVKEALACDVPFVATDVSDLHDIAAVEPSCRICPPDAALIARDLLDVVRRFPSVALRKHVEAMDVRQSTERLIEIYESLLQTKRNEAGALMRTA